MSALQEAMKMRQKLKKDIHYPQYHLTPPGNWMNDPNGMIFWQGKYHVFYQYNPEKAFWNNLHWGHAVSADLVYWQDLPIALTPSPHGVDKGGCWSGCTVDDHGVPTILYTAVWPEVQCIATGSPDLVTWQKFSGNPVLAEPPDALAVNGFRDPCVWRENDSWYMLLGTGLPEQGGAVLLYHSADLRNWEYRRPLLVSDTGSSTEVWECPAFFPLRDKHVLLISVSPEPYNPKVYTMYMVGTYQDETFTPESRGILDHGRYFYAPQTLLDGRGRRIMLGWLREGRDDAAAETAGWSGAQSIPRVLDLAEDGSLIIEPAPELALLHQDHYHLQAYRLKQDAKLSIPLAGRHLEIRATLQVPSEGQFCLRVFASPDEEEYTDLVFNCADHTFWIDRMFASLSDAQEYDRQQGTFVLGAEEEIRIQILLDGSTVELFVNETSALSDRVYPTRQDSIGVYAFSREADCTLDSFDVWTLQSIWR
jgi:beta-fructofuranosidase